MSDRLLELKWILQTLGLPVAGQIHVHQEDCSRVERLAGAYFAAHGAVHASAGEMLTPAQTVVLAALDRRLAAVRKQGDSFVCTELAMRQSDDWREVRRMARAALLRFHWKLELPPFGSLASNQSLS